MKTYLVFLQNLRTGEDFVAPASAGSHDEAMLLIGEKYPPRLYKMQTSYMLEEIERIVADVRRWPGVASSVQQPLGAPPKPRVAVGGSLPPLPGQKVAQAPLPAAAAPQMTLADAMAAIRAMSKGATVDARMEVIEEAPVPPKPVPARAPMRTVAASIVTRKPAPTGASVLDVLKALRG